MVSESRKAKPHGGALAWLQSLELGQGFFSAVTIGEIQKGVELTRRQDPAKANEIEAWAAQLERTSQVLPMDAACFREYARLMHGRSETLIEGCDDNRSCTELSRIRNSPRTPEVALRHVRRDRRADVLRSVYAFESLFIWLTEFGMRGEFYCRALQELRLLLWLIVQDGHRSFVLLS